MAFQDVESIVLRGDPSDVWLDSIVEEDIVEYLGVGSQRNTTPMPFRSSAVSPSATEKMLCSYASAF